MFKAWMVILVFLSMSATVGCLSSPDFYETSAKRTNRLQSAKKHQRAGLDLAAPYHPEGSAFSKFFEEMEHESFRDYLPPRNLIIVLQNGQADRYKWTYSEEKKAIYTPNATEYSDIWTGALLSHAIFHAKMHRDRGPERTPVQANQEEMDAHRLEHEILDGYTEGKYFKLIDEFLETQKSLSESSKWVSSIDDSLFQQADELFPVAKTGDEKSMRRKTLLNAMNFHLAKKRDVDDAKMFAALRSDLVSR